MAEVVLFHHVQGLTPGVAAIADDLRAAGHTVHAPDLFDGRRAATIPEGIALVGEIGEDELARRADAAVAGLPAGLVTMGMSWGAAVAQRLAQTRPGARGAVLLDSCLPITGDWAVGPWPDGPSVQVHGMAGDPYFAEEGDLESARALVAALGPGRAELFLYEGDGHLFADRSLPSYDAAAAALVLGRVRAFLDRVG